MTAGFSASLRGKEIVSLKHIDNMLECLTSFVLLPLLGRFKADIGTRYHIINIAAKSAWGIAVGKWCT